MKARNSAMRFASEFVSLVIFVTTFGFSEVLAQAESDELVLEEIIVTSQRREQSLREVPISVTAFTEDSLRNNMIDVTIIASIWSGRAMIGRP